MKTIKWIIFFMLGTWGFLSFCVLAGDEDPNNPMSMTRFFMTKAGAALSLYLCCRVGKLFNNHGLLPDIKLPEEEDEEWED